MRIEEFANRETARGTERVSDLMESMMGICMKRDEYVRIIRWDANMMLKV